MESDRSMQGTVSGIFLVVTLLSLFAFLPGVYAADSDAPEILSHSPSGKLGIGDNDTLVVITDEEAYCRVDVSDVPYSSMNFSFNDYNTTHLLLLSLEDGFHTYYVRCRDMSNNTMNDSYVMEFSLDTQRPAILEYSPSSISGFSYELAIKTDEEAYCRYSSNSGKSFFDMKNSFDNSENMIHKKIFNDLEEKKYTYYARCVDGYGNPSSSDFLIEVEVDTPPTAQIFLSDPSPVRPGTIEVTLVISEEVQDTPSLSYSLQDSSGSLTKHNIPLSGSGQNWKGNMLIAETSDKKIGSFSFEAVDLKGNTGTRITYGNTFLVDSRRPPKVQFLRAEAQSDGSIKLRWYVDEEKHDIEEYRIYRAKGAGVTNLDYYESTDDDSYIDTATQDNTRYFYKVAAVDIAGNDGLLSEEVSVVADAVNIISGQDSEEEQETEENDYKLTNNLIQEVDAKKQDAEELLFEVKELELELGSDNAENKDLKEQFGFSTIYKNSQSRIESLMAELENLKYQELTDKEFDFEMKRLNLKLDSIKKEIPENIKVQTSEDFPLTITTENMQDAVQNIFNLLRVAGIDNNDRERYVAKNEEIQQNFEIQARYSYVEMTNQDSSKTVYTLVEKDILSRDPKISRDKLSLIESIPKSVAEDVKDITFLEGGAETIKRDPVVRFALSGMNSIRYYVEGKIDPSELSSSNSVIVTDPEDFFYEAPTDAPNDDASKNENGNQENKDMITGNLISAITNNPIISRLGIFLGVVIIAGLLVYYFFFLGKETSFLPPENERYFQDEKAGKNLKNSVTESAAPASPKREEHHPRDSRPGISEGSISSREIAAPLSSNQDRGNFGLDFGFIYRKEENPEYEKFGIKSLKETDYFTLLRESHRYADELDFDSANRAYYVLLTELTKLPSKEKDMVQSRLRFVKAKLDLIVKINQAHSCARINDYINLSYILNDVAGLYNYIIKEFPQSTRLMEDIKKWHTTYASELVSYFRKMDG